MTRATLTERLRSYDRLWGWIAVAVGPAMLLLAFAGPSLLPLVMQPRPGPPEGPEKWLAVIPALVIAGVATLLLAAVIWCGRWTARKFGLRCPSCGVPLTGRYRRAALGAGACGRCHARVVDDAPACFAGVMLPTRNEFLTRLGEYRAAYRREGEWGIRALMLCFLPGAAAVWPFSAFVEPCLRPAGLLWLAELLFVAVWLSPFLVFGHFLSRWEGRLTRSHGLACRWCGASLTGANGKRAEAAGRCGGCGQPVWADAA